MTDSIIERLIQKGIYKTADGRQLWELTLPELLALEARHEQSGADSA